MKNKHQAVKIAWRGHRAPRGVVFTSRTPRQWPGPTLVFVCNHCSSAAIPCQKMSWQMQDSKVKPKNNDSAVAWTDGACKCIQDAGFRRAGCGVFFSVGDNKNRSFTLPGREQTNNRAELLAANAAMRVQNGNLEIMSDSEYVVRIVTGLLQGERQLNNEGDEDLWDEFVTELRLKDTRQLNFVWIKGHTT